MSWTWVKQAPHKASADKPVLHVLVGNDEYLAFITEIMLDNQTLYKAVVPNDTPESWGKAKRSDYHYTHYTLQDAKDWCIAELVNRRLT